MPSALVSRNSGTRITGSDTSRVPTIIPKTIPRPGNRNLARAYAAIECNHRANRVPKIWSGGFNDASSIQSTGNRVIAASRYPAPARHAVLRDTARLVDIEASPSGDREHHPGDH